MPVRTCHAEKNKVFCDNCHHCVWEWKPECGAPKKENSEYKLGDDWLPPGDCPYCDVEFNWQSMEDSMQDIAEWIMTTRTDIVFG